MTFDEMPAGREMDALVAETVMGCRYIPDYHRWELPNGRWSIDLPEYSTDITAAWQVVERMISTGALRGSGDVVLYYVNNDGSYYDHVGGAHWYCALQAYEDGPEYDFDADGAIADTAPLAICRAAAKLKRDA
jgi:hypothetical protein